MIAGFLHFCQIVFNDNDRNRQRLCYGRAGELTLGQGASVSCGVWPSHVVLATRAAAGGDAAEPGLGARARPSELRCCVGCSVAFGAP